MISIANCNIFKSRGVQRFKAQILILCVLFVTTGSFAALHGSYFIGPSGDFLTLKIAVDSLLSQGIGGRVKFNVEPGAYDGPLTIGSFPGAGDYPVSFNALVSGTVSLIPTDTTRPVFTIDSVSNITVQGLAISSLTSSQPALRIANGAEGVSINLCDLFGHANGTVVEILGALTSDIELTNCNIRRGGDGIVLSSESNSGAHNRILHCVIDSVQRGVFVTRQNNCLIEQCEIKPNSGTGNGATGISIGVQNPGDSVLVLRNQISEIRSASGYAVAVRHAPQSGSARLVAANNFIYGFQNTGSSQVRALFLSAGDNWIVNNSILANDVTASGASYAIYDGLTSADSRVTLLNNILVNLEATRTAYNLFVLTSAGGLVSNNNIFHGTGLAYQLGWFLTGYPDLSSWKIGTSLDGASKSGDPQFVTNSDLHLLQSGPLAHQNGAVVGNVTVDIDGTTRFQPPDIGADEYAFAAPPYDVAILDVIDLPSAAPEFSLLTLRVVVQNRGTLPLSDVPLQLSLADTLRAEVSVNLEPSASDTVLLVWSTGAANQGEAIQVNAHLPSDSNPEDNSRDYSLIVTDQPMQGIYTVGGIGGDYLSLSAGLADLAIRGMSGPVSLELESGVYQESVQIAAIPGLSSLNTLIIRPSTTTEGLVQIAPTGSGQAIRLTSVSHVTLEGLVIQGNASMSELLRLENGSSFNEVRECRLIGAALDQTASSALAILGGGCNANRVTNCELSGSFHGLRIEGSSLQRDSANVISGCTVSSVRTGLLATWQHGMRIEQSGFSAGFTNAPAPCYAVRIGAQAAGDTVTIEACRIQGGESAGALFGVSNEANSGTVVALNNWIGDFAPTTTGDVIAVSCLSGSTVLWHNSVEIGEPTLNHAVAISVSGPQAILLMRNNIFRVQSQNGQAQMIDWDGGAIDADYNLYETPGANPQFRFAATSLDEDFQTLAAWTDATLQDSNSVSTTAGFVGENDLHVRPDAAGPSNRGETLPQVALDIDGEPRGLSPDLGADEYSYLPAIVDVIAEELEVPLLPLTTGATYPIFSVVHNVGQLDAPDVLVELLFNGVTVDTQHVNLVTGDYRELFWEWTAPSAQLAFGTLAMRTVATGDLVPSNDLLSRAIVVTGDPLQGVVTVGGTSPTFGTLTELAEQLKWRGISSQLNVRIAPGLYPYALELDPIPGASSTNRVVVEPDLPGSVTITANNSAASVHFRGTAYVELRGLNIVSGSGTTSAVLFEPGSCFNTLSNCVIAGAGLSNITSNGVQIGGAGCIANVISECAISSAYVGVALTGSDYNLSQDNVVRGNIISDVYYGVWVDHQVNAEVSQNDIQPGSLTGPANACYGVYVVQLGTGGSLRVEGNKLHGFLDSIGPRSNRAAGVYSAAGGNSAVEIVNNFIYGFGALTTLRSRAVYLSSGTHLVANNSIRLDDSPSDNETAGIFISTGVDHQVYNNCVLCYENDVPAYALDIESGADALSDYNCWWGNSTNFAVAQTGVTNYTTLANWQAFGQDAHGRSVHADYQSASDLHMTLTDSSLFAVGVSLPEVTQDIDGDVRQNPPCMGADEYTPEVILGTPGELTIEAISTTRIRLRWQAATNATLYRIYAAATLDELANNPTVIGTTAELEFIVSSEDSLFPIQFFHVRAE
jgi:hypothetical protein